MLGLMLIRAWGCYVSVPHWKEAQESAASRGIQGGRLSVAFTHETLGPIPSITEWEEERGGEKGGRKKAG